MNKKSLSIIFIIIVILFGIGIVLLFYNNKNKPVVPEIKSDTTINDKSIKLQYFIGYNYSTGEIITDTIPMNEITITGKNYDLIMSYLNNLRVYKNSCDGDMYNCYNEIYDEYKLVISNDKYAFISKDMVKFSNNDNKYKTKKELYDLIKNISNDYNKKNVLKHIDSDSITIEDVKNDKKYVIDDKDKISKISDSNYYFIKNNYDFNKEKLLYKLYLSDGRVLNIYLGSILGRIDYDNGDFKNIYIGDLDYIVKDCIK